MFFLREQKKIENCGWFIIKVAVTKIRNGEWGMGNGEWGVGNGE